MSDHPLQALVQAQVQAEARAHAAPVAAQARRWALIELFGHSKVAGAVSKDDVFGTDKLRVDVPRVTFVEELYEHGVHKCITRVLPEHTTYYGTGAIFSLSIIDEAAAVLAAHKIRHEPVKAWHLRDALEQLTLAEREALLQPQEPQDPHDRPF